MTHNNGTEGDCSDDTISSTGPFVSIGCVVFPVFVLVWYRYSKQHCRTFGRDGCGTTDFEDDDYEQHQPSDEEDDAYSPMVLTDRLVKWINRQNVFSGFEGSPFGMQRAAAAAAAVLDMTARENSDTSNTTTNSNYIDSTRSDCFCDEIGIDGDIGLFWECIPNMQRQSAIELTSDPNRSPTNEDNSNTTDSSEAEIMVAESNETQNSILINPIVFR